LTLIIRFKHSLGKSENRDFTVFFKSKYREEFLFRGVLTIKKTKSLVAIDEFCTINECIVIYINSKSSPQVLHIILLENLWIFDFMAPKHHEMWMNSRYDLWYLFRHIWATFSFIAVDE